MTGFTAGAVAICGVLAVLEAAQVLGGEVPRSVVLVVASVSAVLAATVAVRNVAFVWRGPVIRSFPRGGALLCDGREAPRVRAAAQLRGTMGGAGYLHPRRLALPAIAWSAASMQSIALLPPQRSATTFVPLGVVLLAAALTAVFPARPFFYREASAGCVLGFPPAVCRQLLDAAGAELAVQPVDLGMFASGRTGEPPAASDAKAASDDAAERGAPRPDRSTPV